MQSIEHLLTQVVRELTTPEPTDALLYHHTDGHPLPSLSVLTEISQAEGTQYSWQYAIVAECEGRVVGSVVGYDGAKLAELREGTFAVLRNRVGRVPDIADETEAGEHYLDSLSVAPQYQRLGIGSRLIDAFCQRAFSLGANASSVL